MITADNAIILGLAVPLIVAILTPIFATRPDIRDCLGPIGGVISLYAAILVARAVIGGETPEWFIISISEGLNFSFKVTTPWRNIRVGCIWFVDYGGDIFCWLYAR